MPGISRSIVIRSGRSKIASSRARSPLSAEPTISICDSCSSSARSDARKPGSSSTRRPRTDPEAAGIEVDYLALGQGTTMGRLAAIRQFKQLRGWAQALHRDQAGDPEDDCNERNRTPPVL